MNTPADRQDLDRRLARLLADTVLRELREETSRRVIVVDYAETTAVEVQPLERRPWPVAAGHRVGGSALMSYLVSDLVRRSRLPRSMKRRPEAKLVLLSLAGYCHDDGSSAWPSVATLAAETEAGRRTVDKCLADLQAHQIIAEQARPTQHRPRIWRLNLEVLRKLSDTQQVATLTRSDDSPDTHDRATLTDSTSNPDTQDVATLPGSESHIPDSGSQVQPSGSHDRAHESVPLNLSVESLATATSVGESTDKVQQKNGDVLEEFSRLFREHIGIAYQVHPGDRGKLDALVTKYGRCRLTRMAVKLLTMPATEDLWIGQSDRSVKILRYRAHKLATLDAQSTNSQPVHQALEDFRDRLKLRATSHDWHVWLSPCRLEGNGLELVVTADGPEHVGWLERHHRETFEAAAQDAGFTAVRFTPGSRGAIPSTTETSARLANSEERFAKEPRATRSLHELVAAARETA